MNAAPSSPGGKKSNCLVPPLHIPLIIISYLPRHFLCNICRCNSFEFALAFSALGSLLFAGCNFIAKLSNWYKKPPPHPIRLPCIRFGFCNLNVQLCLPLCEYLGICGRVSVSIRPLAASYLHLGIAGRHTMRSALCALLWYSTFAFHGECVLQMQLTEW